MGNRKAAVLPEPVWAHAMRSRPSIMMGRAYFCTGVGLEYSANCVCECNSARVSACVCVQCVMSECTVCVMSVKRVSECTVCVCDECVNECTVCVCVCMCVGDSVHVHECHYAMASLLAPILYCCSMTTGHAYLNVGLDDLPEITFSETFLVLGAPFPCGFHRNVLIAIKIDPGVRSAKQLPIGQHHTTT